MSHFVRVDRARAAASLAAFLSAACGLATSSNADWFPVTGTKTGASADVESSPLYVGPRLQVFGGSLDFLGAVTINGPVLLEEQSGWGAPVVNVAGVLQMNGSSFRAHNGPSFTAIAAGSSINTSFLTVSGGSIVKVGSVAASNNVGIVGAGSALHLMGNYGQTGGEFRLGDFGVASLLNVGGSFMYTGNRFIAVDGSTFSVGNAAASSINTGFLTVSGGTQVKVNAVTASDNVAIVSAGSSLQVLNNFTQTGGEFRLGDFGVASLLNVGGSFNYTGNRFMAVDGSTFSVGNAAASSINTGFLTVSGGSQVTVGSVTASNTVVIVSAGSSLHLLGNFSQTGGDFRLGDFGVASLLDIDGSFNYTGSRFMAVDGSTFTVGNAASSSINTGFLTVSGGSQVAVGSVSASDSVAVVGDSSSLNVLSNYTQVSGVAFVGEWGLLNVGTTLKLANSTTLDGSFAGRIELGMTALPALPGEIRIGSGGTLAGNGLVIGKIVVESGGTISPGSSPGPLEVAGSLRFLNDANLSLELAGPGSLQSDRVQVSGNLTLAGTLALQLVDGFIARPSDVVSLVSIGATRNGTFDSIVPPHGYAAEPTYNSAGLTISLSRTCAADLNADDAVDDADFIVFVFAYNILDCTVPAMPSWCPADINDDNVVDDADFGAFVGAYDQLLCP